MDFDGDGEANNDTDNEVDGPTRSQHVVLGKKKAVQRKLLYSNLI